MRSTIYPFHDGRLMSLHIDEGIVVLGLMQADGARHRMTLEGVEALRVDEFRQGNIILDLRSVSGKPPADEDMRGPTVEDVMDALFPGPHVAAAAHHHDGHAVAVAARLARVARGEAALLVLTPSYGAELHAYCAAIDVRAEPR